MTHTIPLAARQQRPAALVVAALALLLFGCTTRKKNDLGPQQAQAIDRFVESSMKTNAIPGLALALIRNGVVVKQVTTGVADLATGERVTAATPFQLASTTKSLTATAVLLLAGEGRLELDGPAGEILDDLPESWRRVTVRQLLSHTSGIPDIVRIPGQLDLIAGSWEEALPLIATAGHPFGPGEKWAYTQTNYVLLARMIERVTGKTLESFLAERLFQPLGMTNTFYPSAAGGRSCAKNYERGKDGTATVRRLDFPPFVHAAGGLCSSLADLVLWNRALDEGKVLPPELARELWTSTRLEDGSPVSLDGKTTGYGLGWVVDDSPGHKAVGHSGGNSTAYRRYLDDGLTIVVLHNGVLDPDGMIASIAAISLRAPGDAGPTAQERLWDAAMNGNSAEIVRALDDGADIEALDTRRSRNGRRALNWAALGDRAEAVRVLLAHGAAIDAVNKTGFTALHHAAEAGARSSADVLLAAGANRSLVNATGDRPADTARKNGHAAVASAIESAPVKRQASTPSR